MEWCQKINAIIILNNEHCFKEDPEYGRMMKKMWEGDLDPKDRKRINTRVIGYNGLELPSILQGKYQIIHIQNIFFSPSSYLHQHVCNINHKGTLVMHAQPIKNVILFKHQYSRSISKIHIHQSIAM